MRHRELSGDLEELLKTRVYISRELRVFAFKDLRTNWSISRSTFYRYTNDDIRAYSKAYARKTYLVVRQQDRSKCAECARALTGHQRCRDCTKLMHEVRESFCGGCVGTRLHRKMALYE